MEVKNNRRKIAGVVVADKMDKTITVETTTYSQHSLYSKKVKTSKKYIVHDEKNEAHIGDEVVIVETRPLSARKRFRLLKITKVAEKVA